MKMIRERDRLGEGNDLSGSERSRLLRLLGVFRPAIPTVQWHLSSSLLLFLFILIHLFWPSSPKPRHLPYHHSPSLHSLPPPSFRWILQILLLHLQYLTNPISALTKTPTASFVAPPSPSPLANAIHQPTLAIPSLLSLPNHETSRSNRNVGCHLLLLHPMPLFFPFPCLLPLRLRLNPSSPAYVQQSPLLRHV
jgi:hypothetical protein